MQVRTRVIDDEVRAFLAAGHRQVVILGAGFDTRASRFPEARIFEVDHPATQARKRAIVGDPPSVTYLPWDFEAQPVAGLPAALAAAGHDPSVPTLTIWEGVTMYLTRAAIDATTDAVAAYSAPGSPFVVNYLEARMIAEPPAMRRVIGWMVARRGEPFVSGFDPAELDAWAASHGLALGWDEAIRDAGARLLPEAHAMWTRIDGHRIALFRRG
jgi:methyltransferase (TIGR00027 family)